MHEICFCGWTGDLADREPVLDERGEWVLRCPNPECGHVDDLHWLPAGVRNTILDEARRRGSKVVAHDRPGRRLPAA